MSRAALDRRAGPSTRLLDGLPIVHDEMPAWIDGFLAQRNLTWQQLERGELWNARLPFDGLDELQFFLICSDPVRWVECHLIETPKNGGGPWRLLQYQKPALRWRRSLILKCGAETGKSRHLVAKILYRWDAAVAVGAQLLGATQDGQLDLLYEDMRYYLEANPRLRSQIDEKQTRVKPYRKLVNRNGNVVYLRPAAADGEAFRGIHVNLGAYFDEAAKADNARIMSEFFRATQPSAVNGPTAPDAPTDIVSVPDGRRDTEFYRLSEQAVPVAWAADDPSAIEQELRALAAADPNAVPVFRWRKTDMPPPFWTEERKAKKVAEFGGIDSAGYQQNVLGEDSDPAGSVFPWPIFARSLRYLPDYVAVKLLWDEAAGVIHVDAYRPDPSYSPAGSDRPRDPELEAVAAPVIRDARDEEIPLGALEPSDILRRFLRSRSGPMVVGGDLGASDDPSEFLIFDVVGQALRLCFRLHLKRFPYPAQRGFLSALRELADPSYGWGLDSTGVGTAVEHELHAQDPEIGLQLSGFVMNAATLARSPEDGEVLRDPDTGAERRITYKEMGTQLLEHAFAHQRIELPWDPDLMEQFPGHKARLSRGGKRVFDHTHDHLIDASRCAILRRFLLEHGALAAVPITYASLGSRTSRSGRSLSGGGTMGRIGSMLGGLGGRDGGLSPSSRRRPGQRPSDRFGGMG